MAEDNKLMEERVDVLIRVRYFSESFTRVWLVGTADGDGTERATRATLACLHCFCSYSVLTPHRISGPVPCATLTHVHFCIHAS